MTSSSSTFFAVAFLWVTGPSLAGCPFVDKPVINPRSRDCLEEAVNSQVAPDPAPAAILTRPPNRRVDEPKSPAPQPPRRSTTGGMIFPNDRFQDSPEGQSQCLGRPDLLYNGCGTSKTCFGFPTGCEETRDCKALATVRVVFDVFIFQAMVNDPEARYIAVGLAPSDKMYASSSMECQLLRNGQGLDVRLYTSWNLPNDKDNTRTNVHQDAVQILDNSVSDGRICCEFIRVNKTKIDNYEFYIDEKPYYLLIASGKVATSEKVGYHDILRAASSESSMLSRPAKIAAASAWLLRLHGALMVLAWLFCVPLGSLTARYFRRAWGKGLLCGAALWFSWHRIFMLAALSLSGIAGLATLIHIKGWSQSVGIHGILGAVTVLLAVSQVLGSFLRPGPDHPKRPVFNWIHHTCGYAAQLLAVVVVYLSVGLPAARVPTYLYYVISVWVVFYISMHALHTLSEVRPFYFLIIVFGLAVTTIAIVVIVVISPGAGGVLEYVD